MKGGRGAFFGSNIGSSRGAFSGLRSVQSIQTMVPATSREVPLGTSLPSVELSETPILPDVSNDFSLTDSAMDINIEVHADSALPEQVPVELLDVPVQTCALTSCLYLCNRGYRRPISRYYFGNSWRDRTDVAQV